MSPHGRTVLRDLGVVLHVPGLMALASLPVCWIFGEAFSVAPLLATTAVSIGLGQALYWPFRHAAEMRLTHAMITAVLSWALVPLIGALPFLLVASATGEAADPASGLSDLRPFWNALFESVSGFTSTGLSMVERPSQLPHTLQWWRSFSQWVGGVGVIVLMLSVFHPAGDAYRLYFAEGREKTIFADVGSTVRTIWWIYLLYTAIGIGGLWLAGMTWWQAVNYGMTGIATGGFGITDNSMADFGPAARLAMIGVMLLGAISFASHYRILAKGKLDVLWQQPEHVALAVLMVAGTVLLTLENVWHGGSALWLDSLFQWTSALLTAGFSTVAVDSWSPTALILLSLAMACGGAAGATTGGLKLRRILLLADAAHARILGAALHPWRLMEHKPIGDAEDEAHSQRLLEAAATMAALWALAALLGCLLLLHAVGPAAELDHVVLEVSSALGNVGLSTGIAGPDLPWFGKLGLIVVMWMGRLEILPILVLLAVLLGWFHHRLQPWRD